MIRAGLAWHDKQDESQQSAGDRRLYAAAEMGARADGRGLWRDPSPVAPWDFRKHENGTSQVPDEPYSPVLRPTSGIRLSGRVQEVMSGSCLKIVDLRNIPVDICLRYAAAPEQGQPSAEVAKKHLEDLVLNETVTIFITSDDEDGEFFLGEVISDRYNVGPQMVRDGVAWYYREGASRQSAEERILYEQSEIAARSERRGLWRETSPTPPWVYQARREAAGGSSGYSYGYGGYGGGSSSNAGTDVYVRGYTRSNGTYVHSYTRSLPGQGSGRGSGRGGGSRGGWGRGGGGRGGRN
jgi:endonuclease YncB( thermonuclease family)